MDATAIVVSAEVSQGSGTLAHEPITTAVLRDSSGGLHTVRIVGGPTPNGFARVAGYVVPVKGMRVALDLKEPPLRSSLFPLSTTTPTWRPSDTPGKWASLSLPILFTLVPSSSTPLPDAISELEVAARTWARPTCTDFRATATTTTTTTIAPGDDGVNGVFFHNDWPAGLPLEPGALGQTVTHADASGNYRDTDIHINTKDFQFGSGGQDLRSVFVHEIGHALGLGHSENARATMNASGSGLRWRSLEQDDIDGVCALYPGSKTAIVCDPSCPPDFVCVGGACQKKGEGKDLCSPCPLGDLGTSCEASGDDARCIDLPNSGGRVCGRACRTDVDCGGEGFSCQPTTEAGDRQCISLTGCKNGANTCNSDAECNQFEGAACRNGVCAGPPTPSLPSDAGTDATLETDAGNDDISARGGGDCDCRSMTASSSSSNSGGVLFLIVFSATWYRRRRRRRHL